VCMLEDFPLVKKKRGLALPTDLTRNACGKTQGREQHELVNCIVSLLEQVELSLQRRLYVLQSEFRTEVLIGRGNLIHWCSLWLGRHQW
jgi:hypothetical protein